MSLPRILLALFVALSAVWGALFWGSAAEVARAVVGALTLWLVGGALLWLVALAVRRRRPLNRLLLAVPWLAALLLFQGWALVVVLRERSLDASERAYVSYFNDMVGCYERHSRTPALQREVETAAAREDWSEAERAMRRHRDELEDLRICLGELADTGEPEVDAAATGLADAIAMRVVADDFYAQGYATGDPKVFDRGDEHERRARAAVREAIVRVHRIGWSHDRWVQERMDDERLLELARPVG